MALFGQGVAEMFKDVVPQSSQGYGDNTIDWANVKPFQVIKPMISWASTNTGATAPTTKEVTPQSEYQKWLAQQSGMKSSRDGGGQETREPGWYERTTPEERAAFFAENPTMASISRMGMQAWQGMNPYNLAAMQEKQTPGMLSGYLAETYGLPSNKYAEIAAQMAINGQGGFMAGPAPNANMSLADQYEQYGLGRQAATSMTATNYDSSGNTNPTGYAADGMGPPSSAAGGSVDSYSGGGSYAGGDYGYSGPDRGDYF